MKKNISAILLSGLVVTSPINTPNNTYEIIKSKNLLSPEPITQSIEKIEQANEIVKNSDISEKYIPEEMWSMTIDEVKVAIIKEQTIQKQASQMADIARELGINELSETIQSAKIFWEDANNAENKLQEVLEVKEELANRILFTYNINTKTNLSKQDFDSLLTGTQLEGFGQLFYNMEQTYNVNGLFAIAVAKTESGLGISNIAKSNNNYFGMIGKNFITPKECIMHFGDLMNNPLYYGKSIEDVAKKYCPPTWEDWAKQNKQFMFDFWTQLQQ